MKTKAAHLLAVLLVSGCATQSPRFAGHSPQLSGDDAETVWLEQMNRKGAAHAPWLQNVAVVRAARGSAIVQSEGFHKRARVGMQVPASSSVRTSNDGQLDFFLGENGPVVRMMDDSVVKFVRLDIQKRGEEKIVDTMIELQEGRIRGAVKNLAPESSYMLRTKAGVITFRAAKYEARADGTCSIIAGSAKTVFGGKTFVINAGEEFRPGIGIGKSSITEEPRYLANVN